MNIAIVDDCEMEELPVMPCFVRSPKAVCAHRQKLPGILITRRETCSAPFLRILARLRGQAQPFEGFGITYDRNLCCPIIPAIPLFDIITVRQIKSLQTLTQVIEQNIQRMRDISQVPVVEQLLHQLTARHALFRIKQEHLQKTEHLSPAGFDIAEDLRAVPPDGKRA